MKLKVLCSTALLAAASLAFGPPSNAAPADKPKTQKPRQVPDTGEEAAQPTTARRSAAADQTGEEALEQMTSRSTEGLQARTLPSGAEAVDLEGRFMHVSMAVSRADGSKAVTCTTSPKALATARPAAPVPSKAPVVLEEK